MPNQFSQILHENLCNLHAEDKSPTGRVRINVGGTVFEASVSTLTRFRDSVLGYLRDGENAVFPKDEYSLECLKKEAEFYNLPGLVEICCTRLSANAKAEDKSPTGRVKINVGGTVFGASVSTLTKFGDSMLSALIADRWKTKDELFIDRNSAHFGKVLDYLRDGEEAILPKDEYSLECLRRDAEFYNLPGLVEICCIRLSANAEETSRVKINVGGTYFETLYSNLAKEKDSVLFTKAVSSLQGREELFFDRDPALFAMVINYLRDGKIIPLPEDWVREKLRKEAEFYNLPGLSMCICMRTDYVQLLGSASKNYRLLDVRKSYNGRSINRCKTCTAVVEPFINGGINVPSYIVIEKDGMDVTYGVTVEQTLSFGNKSKDAFVKMINGTCCNVYWDYSDFFHVPKSELRLSKLSGIRRDARYL